MLTIAQNFTKRIKDYFTAVLIVALRFPLLRCYVVAIFSEVCLVLMFTAYGGVSVKLYA